jgi:hypothetical protein
VQLDSRRKAQHLKECVTYLMQPPKPED